MSNQKLKNLIPVGSIAIAVAAAVTAANKIIKNANGNAEIQKENEILRQAMSGSMTTDETERAGGSALRAIKSGAVNEQVEDIVYSSGAKLTRKSDGTTFVIAGNIDFGRAPYNDIQIVDARVSRVHCRLFVSNSKYYIVDLNATTKARLNGKEIDNYGSDAYMYQLNNNDIIVVGNQEFVFNSSDASDKDYVDLNSGVTAVTLR